MKFLRKLLEQLQPSEEPLPINERRSTVRLSHRVDVSVQAGDRYYPATVVNLTFTGLCLEMKIPLDEEQDITLHREDLGPAFNATVIWSKPSSVGKMHLVGVECELDEDKLVDSWLEPALIQAGFEARYVNEQRKLIRVPSDVTCDIAVDGESLGEARLLDLSVGGALVELLFEPRRGSLIRLQAPPLGKLPALRREAKVASARATDQGSWLCGLQFEASDDEEIHAYMESLKKAH